MHTNEPTCYASNISEFRKSSRAGRATPMAFSANSPSVPSFLRALRVLRGSFLSRNRWPLPDPAAKQFECVSCSDVWPMLGRKFVTNTNGLRLTKSYERLTKWTSSRTGTHSSCSCALLPVTSCDTRRAGVPVLGRAKPRDASRPTLGEFCSGLDS